MPLGKIQNSSHCHGRQIVLQSLRLKYNYCKAIQVISSNVWKEKIELLYGYQFKTCLKHQLWVI